MPSVVLLAVAFAAGSVGTWWISRCLAPRGAESQPHCGATVVDPMDSGDAVRPPGSPSCGHIRRRVRWHMPMASAAVQQPMPAAPPVPPAPQPLPVAAGAPQPAPVAAGAPQPPPAAADAPQPPPVAAGAPPPDAHVSSSPTTHAHASSSPTAPPPVPMGLLLPPYAGGMLQWRLDRAEAAGRFARDKLLGRARHVPKTPPGPPGPKSIFVIARAVSHGTGSGIVWHPWDGIRGYVAVKGGGSNIHNDAVFHGFHSREEAESYWNAAFPGTPVTWWPPMF